MVKFSKIMAMMLALSMFVGVTSEAKAEYPTKPITLVSPYGAGGDSDLSARVWAEFAKKELGQPVLVVNKTGAGGLTGTLFASKAKPDGYTLFLAQAGPNIVIPITTSTGGLNRNSFDFLYRFGITNPGVIVHTDAPWNTLKEFEEDVKANKLSPIFADSSATSWLTFAFRGWFNDANIVPKSVSYNSGAEAATSIVGEHTDITMLFSTNYIPLVNAGKLKLLALGAKDPKYPNIPTFNEQGYKGNYFAWSGIAIPAGAPQEVKDKLIEVTDKITQDPEFIKAIENLGFISDRTKGQEFQDAINLQYVDMERTIESLGLKKK